MSSWRHWCLLALCFYSAPGVQSQCAATDMAFCVLRLHARRVPFDSNVLNVVFAIDSKDKLLATCRCRYSPIFLYLTRLR